MTPDPADTVVEQATYVVPDYTIKELLGVIPYAFHSFCDQSEQHSQNADLTALTASSGLPSDPRFTCQSTFSLSCCVFLAHQTCHSDSGI